LPENQPPVQPPEEPCEQPPCLDGYCLKLGVIVKVSRTTCETGEECPESCECEKPCQCKKPCKCPPAKDPCNN
jgi:hypothetical protein